MEMGGGALDRPGSTGRGRPLVVTGDGALLEELLDLAGAGGVELTVAVDALAAEDHWPSAPLVMVGSDQVAAVARRSPPRRLGVVVVGRAGAGVGDPGVEWSVAETLHPEHVVALPDGRSWLVARLAECRPRALRHAAPVVAFVSGSPGAGASTLAVGLAMLGRRQGLSTLLVGADPGGRHADHAFASPGGGGSLAILTLHHGDGAIVTPEAMAAALRAARHGRDLVVVDVPYPFDGAARLALSSADQCYVVVAADVPACGAAVRVAAAARRHCPALALVVRAVVPGGLRPDEVGEALGIPLAGVLPSVPATGARAGVRRPSTDAAGTDVGGTDLDARLRAVSGVCRRLLVASGARRRLTGPWPTEHQAPAASGVNR